MAYVRCDHSRPSPGNFGLIDRNIVDEAYAKLVGFNYQSTHFTGAVMVAALRVSNGSLDAFPVRQIVSAFEEVPSSNRNVAFRLLAEFLVRLTFEPMLPETRCIATKTLLDKFPDDSSTNSQLIAFRLQCAAPMSAERELYCRQSTPENYTPK